MNTILNGAKLPKIEALKKSRRELAGQKKELYAEYRDAQRQMREAVAIKANIDHLLGITASVKIRPRNDSDGPQTTVQRTGTLGQFVPKYSGFGELPNKHFCGPCALQKFRSVATPELLAI